MDELNVSKIKYNYPRAFFEAFIIAVIITWLPLKSLSYISPYICLFWFIIRSGSGKVLLSTFSYIYLFVFLSFFYLAINFVIGNDYLFLNSLLILLTYNSFLYLLATPKKITNPTYSYLKYIKVVRYLVIIQASMGLLQVFFQAFVKGRGVDSSAGDVVQGTINPISFLTSGEGFGNQMFAINMVLMLAFYLPYVLIYKKDRLIFAMGFLALVFSSVMHIFLCFLGSLAVVSFFYRKNILTRLNKPVLAVILLLPLTFIGLSILLPKNTSDITHFALIYLKAKSPKIEAVSVAFTDLMDDYPMTHIIGLGPAQFSSRAGLIATGKYFGGVEDAREYAFLPNQMSEAFEKYVYDIWYKYATNKKTYGNSTMHRPFFSFMSVYIEFGAIFFLISIVLVSRLLLQFRKIFLAKKNVDEIKSMLAFSGSVILLTIIGMGIFENYWETTQAIFPGLILLKFIYCQVTSEQLPDSTGRLEKPTKRVARI